MKFQVSVILIAIISHVTVNALSRNPNGAKMIRTSKTLSSHPRSGMTSMNWYDEMNKLKSELLSVMISIENHFDGGEVCFRAKIRDNETKKSKKIVMMQSVLYFRDDVKLNQDNEVIDLAFSFPIKVSDSLLRQMKLQSKKLKVPEELEQYAFSENQMKDFAEGYNQLECVVQSVAKKTKIFVSESVAKMIDAKTINFVSLVDSNGCVYTNLL